MEVSDIYGGLICFSGRRSGKEHGEWYKRLFGWVLKKITRSKWTHVCFVYNESGVPFVLEATTPKTQRISLDDSINPAHHYRVIVRIPNWNSILSPVMETFKQTIELLWHKYKDTKYGIWQVIFTPLAMLFWSKNLISRGVVCSELVMEGIERRYPGIFENLDPNKISPQDIWERVKFWLSCGYAEIIETIE